MACSLHAHPLGKTHTPQRPMTSSSPTPPYTHPHQKALWSASPPGSCSSQKLSKEERGALHSETGSLGMRWHLRKGLSASKVLLTPYILPSKILAFVPPFPSQLLALALGHSSSPVFFPQVPSTIPPFSFPATSAKALVAPLCTPIPSSPLSTLIPCGPSSQVRQKKLSFPEDSPARDR